MAAAPTVGLDIGSQQIKVVEVRAGKTGLTVSALGVAPTPLGVVQNNIITDPKVMGQTIRQLMKQSGVSARRVVGSVAGQSAVVVRIIEVPKMTDAELKETMKWEVERHVPFAPSETVLDYQPLQPRDGSNPNNPNMEVLLAVAQQDVVSNYLDTAFAAGLDPVAIDIEPLAVARALLDIAEGRAVIRPQGLDLEAQASMGIYPETVAIVNIGASNTDISVFQGDQLTFPRSLPLAGDSLTRAIAEALGQTLEQSEHLKREHGSIQLERMAIYTGTAYGGQEFEENALTFDEDETGFVSGLPDDDPAASPFDFSDTEDLGGFQRSPSQRLGEAQFDDAERTQPMSRRTLNLARPVHPDNPLPFLPPTDGDSNLGLPTFGGEEDNSALRDQVFEAIAPVLGELATELRRSLDYYRSRAQGQSVDRVLLTGGSASLGNLAPFLQNELQVPVSVANPLAALTVTSKHYDPAYLPAIAPAFTIALGLAVRDAVFDANPVPKKPKIAPVAPPAPTAPAAAS